MKGKLFNLSSYLTFLFQCGEKKHLSCRIISGLNGKDICRSPEESSHSVEGLFIMGKKKGSREKRLLQSASRSIAISVRALQSSRASGICLNTDSDSSGGVGSHACRVCGVLRSAVHKLEAREKLVHTLVCY